MLNKIIIFIHFVLLVSVNAINAQHYPRATGGSCTNLTRPTEEQYIAGYNTFCDAFIKDDVEQLSDGKWMRGTRINAGVPLVGTAILTAYDNTTIQWVYILGYDSASRSMRYITHANCIAIFDGLLNGFPANFLLPSPRYPPMVGGGKLGRDYCVVDGSGDEGFSGEGVVLVRQSRADQRLGSHNFYVESRLKFDGRPYWE